jgi:hypothetical protein
MLYPVWHLRLQEGRREAVDRSGQDKKGYYLLYRRELCSVARSEFPRGWISRSPGVQQADITLELIPDVRRPH